MSDLEFQAFAGYLAAFIGIAMIVVGLVVQFVRWMRRR